MKKWQEVRNYRRIKDENGQVLANIITVDGVDTAVTEDVFLAYSQADRRERYITEEVEPGRILSLDRFLEDGVPLEKLGVQPEISAEEAISMREESQERQAQEAYLPHALATLDEPDRQLIQALFFEGVSIREYAKRLGVYHRTIVYRRDKVLEKLRQKLLEKIS